MPWTRLCNKTVPLCNNKTTKNATIIYQPVHGPLLMAASAAFCAGIHPPVLRCFHWGAVAAAAAVGGVLPTGTGAFAVAVPSDSVPQLAAAIRPWRHAAVAVEKHAIRLPVR